VKGGGEESQPPSHEATARQGRQKEEVGKLCGSFRGAVDARVAAKDVSRMRALVRRTTEKQIQ